MCNNCGGEIKLISYKWNNENNTITYVYKCESCEDKKEFTFEIKNEKLKDELINDNLYRKFNL